MVLGLDDSVRDQIPHLRVSTLEVHLHPQSRFTLLERALSHAFEFDQRFRDGTRTVRAGSSGLGRSTATVVELFLGC